MNQSLPTFERVAGVLLIQSTAIPLVGAIALAATGNLAGMYSGPDDLTINLTVRRWTFRLASLAMILALLGFAMLTAVLQTSGERTLSTVALAAFIVAAMGWLLEMTITSSVGETAAREVARSGTLPEYWEPVRHWVNVSLQQVYVVVGLIAIGVYGASLRNAEIVAPWVAWVLIAWAIFWLLAAVLFAVTSAGAESSYFIPGVLLLPPALVGAALLIGR